MHCSIWYKSKFIINEELLADYSTGVPIKNGTTWKTQAGKIITQKNTVVKDVRLPQFIAERRSESRTLLHEEVETLQVQYYPR